MTKAAGWLVAAVMLVAAAGAFVWGLGQKRLADALETRLTQVTENNAALKNTLDEMGTRVDQATQEIQDLEARVAKLQVAADETASPEEEQPSEALKTMMEAHGRKLRADLATVLTADELAVFDDYEANKERRMLESGLDVQLTMFAKGLTEENRDMFRDVIIEEMTAQGYSTNNPENYTNPGGAIERQMTAFQTARDRVVPVLPEDQAAHVDAFIRQMENMMSAQQEMLDMFMNSGDEEEETPGDQETAQ